MTRQRTPYSAKIIEAETKGWSLEIIAELEAKAEGYLRAKADYAPLLAAAELAWRHLAERYTDLTYEELDLHDQLRAAIKQAKEGGA